jgi:regulator of replication initiation timing
VSVQKHDDKSLCRGCNSYVFGEHQPGCSEVIADIRTLDTLAEHGELVKDLRAQIAGLVAELGKTNIRAGDLMGERDALRAECKTLQSELDKETSRADYNLAQCFNHSEALVATLDAKDAIHQAEIRALTEDLNRWKRYGVKGTLGSSGRNSK